MDNKLKKLFEERGPIRNLGVIGMGYVGIPSAVLFAKSPLIHHVYGFQRNSVTSCHKIHDLNNGILPLKGEEPYLEEYLVDVTDSGKFECTSDFSYLNECDAITLAIQTPFLNPSDLVPDFRPLEEGLKNVGKNLNSGTLIVIESTVTPGTTEGMARKILEEESGLIAGEDFGLAHAPERVMVGRLIKNIQEHDRVVGGINSASTGRASSLYRTVLTSGKVIEMSATAAEVTKTAENTFRDLQIAAANQLALYCEAMGVNFYDVRSGIDSLKGDGITRAILWPGAGVGGHCLTKDTYHLERGIQVTGKGDLDFPNDLDSLFITARRINDFMPEHLFHLTMDGLRSVGKDIRYTKIALLGWSFLQNSDDTRNTPAEPLFRLCIRQGAEVRIHDPWVPSSQEVQIISDLDEVLEGSDVVVIVTGHKEYSGLQPAKMSSLMSENPVVIDGRNVIMAEDFVDAGFIYRGIGRGDMNHVE